MENYDPKRVFRDIANRQKTQASFNKPSASSNRPLPQPAPPSMKELEEGAERLRLQQLNKHPERDVLLEKANKSIGDGWIVISLKQDPNDKKKGSGYKGDRIRSYVGGIFKMLSQPGSKRFTVRC